VLERIEVRDYQSLEDIDLLLGRFTVIVGPSGNGKSSLIRSLKGLCFNQVGQRFIRHKQQKAGVRLTLDGGKTVEWEKPRDKGATYTSDDQVYTRVGRAVPEEITNTLGIRRIEIDKSVSFTPQFQSQHDPPLLLTESSTLAARALAKLTKLSVLVEGQMDCRRDLKRVERDHTTAEAEVERVKAQLGELPNVRRVRNVMERANKLMRTIDRQLGIVRQADDIVQDIAGSLLIADLTLPRMEEIEVLSERVAVLDDVVNAVIDARERGEAAEAAEQEVEEARIALVAVEDQYNALVKELGACPLCGSTETWGEHEH
jgi:DNA repair ATPase RecN